MVIFQANILVIGPRGKSILHILLDQNCHLKKEEEKFKKCVDYIFDLAKMGEVDLTKIANHQCLSKHVPLHHAANYWDPGIIGKLFDYGALSSIGMLNNLEEQPISKINPDVSEVILTFAIQFYHLS